MIAAIDFTQKIPEFSFYKYHNSMLNFVPDFD